MDALEESFLELQIQPSCPKDTTESKSTSQSVFSVNSSQTPMDHSSASTLSRSTVVDGLELHKSSVIEDRLKMVWRQYSSLSLLIYEQESR